MTIRLRGITWEHARGYDSVAAASSAYRRVAPEVGIEWTARSLQAFADHPLERLVSDYDLLVIDHPHVPLAADRKLLAALDDHLPPELDDAHFVGASHASYRHHDHQYGLATDAAAQVAAHRPDLCAEVPTSWPQVLELAAAGRVLWPAKPIDAFASLVTVCAGSGAAVMTADGFVTREIFDRSWELLFTLARRVPDACLSANPIEVAERLTGDDHWLYAPLLYGYSNYSRAGYRRASLAYTDIPLQSGVPRGSMLGGAGIAVSAHTRHLDQAAAFACWLAGESTQRGVYFEAGGQPGHRAAWEDPELNAATLDFFTGTRSTLEHAYLRPRHRGYMMLQDIAAPWVTEALRGELTGDDLYTRLDAECRRQLAEP